MIEIQFRAPDEYLSLNKQLTRMHNYRVQQQWKEFAWAYALKAGHHRLGASVVEVELSFDVARRRDPHNYVPTIKPIIDGLVAARYWPDDNPKYVTTLEPVLVVSSQRLVTVRITPREDPQ